MKGNYNEGFGTTKHSAKWTAPQVAEIKEAVQVKEAEKAVKAETEKELEEKGLEEKEVEVEEPVVSYFGTL